MIADDDAARRRGRERERIVEHASGPILAQTLGVIRNRRRLAVVTLDLVDSGEIAIPIQRGAGAHRLPRGATSVSMGERR